MTNFKQDETILCTLMLRIYWLPIFSCHEIIIWMLTTQGEYKLMD